MEVPGRKEFYKNDDDDDIHNFLSDKLITRPDLLLMIHNLR